MVNLNYRNNEKNEFNLHGQKQFFYNQIIHSIPKSWKDALIADLQSIKTLVFQGHLNLNCS